MSVCLGQTVSLGAGRKKMVPKPQDACALPRKKEMARPHKSEPRDRQLNVGLTATEYESLVRRAEAVGMRPVHFGRALLLGRSGASASKGEPADNISRLIHAQLVRLGNNLNQMMRHLHQTGDPLPTDLEPLLTDIRRVIARGVSK
jgi:hypothetical protein